MMKTILAALFAAALPVLAAAEEKTWSYDGPEPGPDGVLVIDGCRIEPKTVCPGADLRFADLKDQNLAGADLTGAQLVRADLSDANLRGAKFDKANLMGAKLQRAFCSAARPAARTCAPRTSTTPRPRVRTGRAPT